MYKRNYWILSPNVSNDPSIEKAWKNAIMLTGYAFMGWGDDNQLGITFKEQIKKGDFILIAQGANRNKRLFIGGIVETDAIWEEKSNTPREAFNRKLELLFSKKELESLNLHFDENSAYGNADRIPAIYKLYPERNSSDKKNVEILEKEILKRYLSKIMKEIIDLLKCKKQIILQGAPGTGKTYTAKDIAEQLIFDDVSSDKKIQAERLKTSEQFKLVQFHPSYTYEDFVRGIEVRTEGGQPEYITKNKIIGKFAELASKNWQDSQKSAEEVSKEEWLTEQFDKFVDFVNEEAVLTLDNDYQLTDSVNIIAIEGDAFRYTGKNWKHGSNRMLFKDIKQAYLDDNKTRQDIKKNNNLSGLAQQHASYYIRVLDNFREYLKSEEITYSPSHKSIVELENYVLIIDEINRANLPAVLGELIYALEYRGEKVESLYTVDGDNGLVLPPNLYIIGTMNTADRSVGQIDYAIRRRFAFVDMLPQKITPEKGIFENELFKKVSELFIEKYEDYETTGKIKPSKYLSDEFRPEDVWIGHSYFITDGNKDTRVKYEIVPILKEYLKDGIFKERSGVEEIINELICS